MDHEAYGLIQTIVMVVVAPVVTALCTWIVKKGQKEQAKINAEVAETAIVKSEEHKEVILKETKVALAETNDVNTKLLRVLERLEAVEKRQGDGK